MSMPLSLLIASRQMRDDSASMLAYSTKARPTTANSVSSTSTTIRMTARRRDASGLSGRNMASSCRRAALLFRLHVLNEGHLPRLRGLRVPDAEGDFQSGDREVRGRVRAGVVEP